MKCTIRRVVAFLAIVAVLSSAMAFHAYAASDATVSSSTYYSSSSCTAGVYKDESVRELQTVMDSGVYGGDVGIWFYSTSVGLQASFDKDTSRRVYIECRETDSVTNTLARRYYAQFTVGADGLYRPRNYSISTTTTSLLEDDGDLELYMRFMVETDEDDTSKSVPTGLLRYKFWAYTN